MTPEQQRAIAIARARRRRAAEQSVRHPEFDGSDIPGYNPETGLVERQYGMGDSALLGAADTATIGFGDEGGAGLVWGIEKLRGNDPEYSEILQDVRQMQTDAQAQNPKSYLTGQVVGGVAQGVATAPASLTVNATRAGAPLLGRVAAGMADGSVFGGLYGLGSGEGTQGRLTEGAIGAGIGVVAGAAFPLLGTGASRAYEAGRNYLAARPIAEGAGASPEALRLLGGVIDADGSLGPRGQANMRAAGREAMLVDAGPTARGMLDTAIQRSGPGSIVATDRVSARVARDAQALTGTLDNTLGAPQGVGSAQNAIRDAAQPQVSQAYQRAYATPIDYASPAGQAVEDVISRIPPRIARTAIERANEIMRYDRMPRQIMADIADDGSISFREMPSVVQADYIKKALDQIAQDGVDPITGRMDSNAAFASRIARDLRNAVGDAVPAYRQALETAADPLSRQNAVRIGARLNSMTRDEFRMAVEGMTQPEKQAVLQGFRSKIDDQMAAVTRAMSDGEMDAREAIKGLRELSSRRTRENISAILPENEAEALFNEIDRITRSFELRASVADNSRTYARQAMDERVRDLTAPGVVRTAARGEPINATQRVIQALTGQTDEAMRSRQDAIYAEIADLLTRQGGAGQSIYDATNRIGRTDIATQLIADRIARGLSGPGAFYPSTSLAIDNRPFR
uniref:Uncharacterized protein n=1 Tax=Chelativorans sp. (strain BNC1) TaxID=266779 RepID=Q11LT2_CHESB